MSQEEKEKKTTYKWKLSIKMKKILETKWRQIDVSDKLALSMNQILSVVQKETFLSYLVPLSGVFIQEKKISSFIFYFLNFLPTKLANLIFFSFIFTRLILFTIFVLFKKMLFFQFLTDFVCHWSRTRSQAKTQEHSMAPTNVSLWKFEFSHVWFIPASGIFDHLLPASLINFLFHKLSHCFVFFYFILDDPPF